MPPHAEHKGCERAWTLVQKQATVPSHTAGRANEAVRMPGGFPASAVSPSAHPIRAIWSRRLSLTEEGAKLRAIERSSTSSSSCSERARSSDDAIGAAALRVYGTWGDSSPSSP